MSRDLKSSLEQEEECKYPKKALLVPEMNYVVD